MHKDTVNRAVEFLYQKGIEPIDTALILGSGLGSFADQFSDKRCIAYSDIPGFVTSTVAGHKGQFVYVDINGMKVMMMQGRWHLYEGYDPRIVVLPVLVMHELGLGNLIVTTASGGLNPLFNPGDLVLIRDHINFLFRNPLIGFQWGDRSPWVDMAEPYSKKLADMALAAAQDLKINLKEGVYISNPGPTYETNAELRMFQKMGDMISMSTIPEVLLARYLDIEVLGISCITNAALPVRPKIVTHEEVIETGKKVENIFKTLMHSILHCLSKSQGE